MHSRKPLVELPVISPESESDVMLTDAAEAVAEIARRYDRATGFLRDRFARVMAGETPEGRFRAWYPMISVATGSFAKVDSRLSFGHVVEPGVYATTITRPDLFRGYLTQQIGLLIQNHGMPVRVGDSDTPIPLHFAMGESAHVEGSIEDTLHRPLRDIFDVPDLNTTDDHIVNGLPQPGPDGARPLAPFTAQRIDYSLARLAHYTATSPAHFQNHILFTNYQFYMDEFVDYALAALADPDSGYTTFVGPGNAVTTREGASTPSAPKAPQMPTYHLIRENHSGISMVNIGVGPSNAKTITDHVAVLRPHVWLMLGHCAGLRNSQSLGDYVLAHAYMREDHVLDDDLPVWVPIPPLAEVQVALQDAVAEITGLTGYELKKIMRTGTVATIDNRNWELRDQSGPVARLSQARAIALDMESATIAANGFRFRVPYGTLLCVSDKPLHGELKLPGMATAFYKRQVAQHLLIGIRAMETLRDMPLERLHSRKLRSFDETAFL
ncbi:AMP nucleosidase [Amaricoccus sp.]|uniref:AMP nucleosidase n=1 Tax=Amaricoccus sp. TaxID=1872485 RepID=UPI001B572223|nr:AMP nucleosidase [Amaricoccus sp.]MBP7003431.1 AMP nucleosidase [Amaricoccus sp.]